MCKLSDGAFIFYRYIVVCNDSVSGQQSPLSDCADAQADLGLCCPYMPEIMFSHVVAHIKDESNCPKEPANM